MTERLSAAGVDFITSPVPKSINLAMDVPVCDEISIHSHTTIFIGHVSHMLARARARPTCAVKVCRCDWSDESSSMRAAIDRIVEKVVHPYFEYI